MTEREYGIYVPELIEIFSVAFLWLVVLLRIPSVRQRDQRGLWLALLLGASAMSLQITTIYEFASRLIGRDLLGANRDIFADVIGLFAAAAIFSFVLNVVGKARYARLTYGAGLLVTTALLLINCYFDPRTPTGLSQDSAAGITYWLVLLLYHFIANVWCAYICWHCFLRTRSSPLKAALLFFSIGTSLAALLMLLSLLHFFTRLNSITHLFPLVRGAEAFLYGAAASVPVVKSISRSTRETVWLSRLYPLWRDITRSIDGLTLHKPRGYFLYLFLASADQRQGLYRKVIELQDGILELKRYVPPQELLAAAQHAQSHGLDEDMAAAAEAACWITSALRNRSMGHQPLADHQDQPQQNTSLSAEAAHLSKVSSFYSSPLPAKFGVSLRQARKAPKQGRASSVTQA
ncbi:MAB_1171c family putative transporter [Mycobacteroides abscessus]